jgi:pyrimidine operon attenuation protein/uracil phosphoribosyltransferase
MSTTERTLVLPHKKVQQKVQRIAHQIVEENFNQSQIILIGIKNRGFEFAQQLFSIIQNIEGAPTPSLESISLSKDNLTESNIILSIDMKKLDNKCVVLIDDVLNSGKTLMYATRHILNADVAKLSTAVLVDRKHRKYPIRADIAGLTLSTTVQEHISVQFENGETNVYLV